MPGSPEPTDLSVLYGRRGTIGWGGLQVEVQEAKGTQASTFRPQPNILWALAFIPALSWASTQVEARMARPRRNSQR